MENMNKRTLTKGEKISITKTKNFLQNREKVKVSILETDDRVIMSSTSLSCIIATLAVKYPTKYTLLSLTITPKQKYYMRFNNRISVASQIKLAKIGFIITPSYVQDGVYLGKVQSYTFEFTK